MKRRVKAFTFPDSYGKAERWIERYKKKRNVILLSSGVGEEHHGRRVAYVCFDTLMTALNARRIRAKEKAI